MKKNLSIGSILLSAVMMVVVLSACQKEQSTVTPETAAISSEQVNIVGVKLDGTVTASYAAALAANYAKVYHEDNQSQYVVFKANDLIAFVNGLKAKGATEVYVNFGVYGKGAAAVNAKDNGRLTVFFTGNKIPAPRGGPRTNAGDEEFLNHGGLVP